MTDKPSSFLVRLAIPDLLLRGPRFHQSLDLFHSSADRCRADTLHHRLGHINYVYLRCPHRFYQLVCSLHATTSHVDRPGNLRVTIGPGDLELLCVGSILGHGLGMRHTTRLYAL